MNIHFKKGHSGFTLIELLVVISIIGMLASITLAATNRARYVAKVGALKKEFDQLQIATQLYFYNHNNSYAGDINNTTAGGIPNNSASGNPTSAGNFCPTAATSLFGYQDVKSVLSAIYNLFPNGTLECLMTTDSVSYYWTVYFTVPNSAGTGWNKWCADNYLYTNTGALQGNTNGSYNRQLRLGVITYCGEITDTPPSPPPTKYSSLDW